MGRVCEPSLRMCTRRRAGAWYLPDFRAARGSDRSLPPIAPRRSRAGSVDAHGTVFACPTICSRTQSTRCSGPASSTDARLVLRRSHSARVSLRCLASPVSRSSFPPAVLFSALPLAPARSRGPVPPRHRSYAALRCSMPDQARLLSLRSFRLSPEHRALPRFLGDPFVRAAFWDPGGVDALRPGSRMAARCCLATHTGSAPRLHNSGLTARPIRFAVYASGHVARRLTNHAKTRFPCGGLRLHDRASPEVYVQSFQVLLLSLWPGSWRDVGG